MAILSIQSHVAYGHAGNSAAVFPLQRLGKEVWAINTVEFSNHTGYGVWKGQILEPTLIKELVEGIADQGNLGDCRAILSGYMGDHRISEAIIQAVERVKSASPNALYCCDPVMGDVDRGIYVEPGIPEIIRSRCIPIADIITPNHFELDLLTGRDTRTYSEARRAIDQLHAQGPGVILVTSYREAGAEEHRIDMLASDGRTVYRVRTPELPFSATMAGSGDVTTAVFLSRYLDTGDIKTTLECTAGSIYGILEATYSANSREMLLVQCQDELIAPTKTFVAVSV